MIPAFIFSRNRACQSHLLMESMARNIPGVFEPYLLWKGDTDEFDRGYGLLASRMGSLLPAGNVRCDTGSPKQDLMRACEYAESTSGFITLFTDDCIVWRKAGIIEGDIESVLSIKGVKCASLRLGRNTTTQNYLTGEEQPPLESADPVMISPAWGDQEDWLAWEAEKFDFRANYGYMAGMDGVCFRASELLESVVAMDRMDTYRAWEGCWHQPTKRAEWAKQRPWIASPEVSCVVNVPANSVQVDPTASGVQHHYSVETLNQKYLDGEVIDLDQFDFSDVRSCHREFPYRFRRTA